jgi:biotin transporter BioY
MGADYDIMKKWSWYLILIVASLFVFVSVLGIFWTVIIIVLDTSNIDWAYSIGYLIGEILGLIVCIILIKVAQRKLYRINKRKRKANKTR